MGELPDLMHNAKVWKWGGIGFGEYELMLLHKSLQKLIQKTGAAQIRLWGKIKGTEKDYFIAEGTVDKAEDYAGPGEGGEDRGTGINKYVYWASTCLLGDNIWT